MVSPFTSQASDLGAEMVDLQNEQEISSYANKVASGKTPKKKSTKKGGGGSGGAANSGDGKTMEVRSRRIMRGEVIYNYYFPALETTLNLALALMMGLASRWIFGLIRSLRLSFISSNALRSLSGPGGPCCSPFRGGDDEGTRLPGSFERLLACVLVKQEGDNAGTLVFTLILFVLIVGIVKMAWSVSTFSSSKNDGDTESKTATPTDKKDDDAPAYKRINPKKVKRFMVGVGVTLSVLMMFHTPSLLRSLGLAGIREAVEELATRIVLFGNLLGVTSLPETYSMDEPTETIQTLMNGLCLLLSVTWGYVAAGMMSPIEETARNAAHILSPSINKTKKSVDQKVKEQLDLMNIRMMLLIQSLAPFIILCTYLANARFSETQKTTSRGDHVKMPFSKQYFQNSGLYVRVIVCWCFVGASMYTLRPLLQSFLDQASTAASAMAKLGEGVANTDANRDKKNAGKSTSPQKPDPFNERYQKIVFTAGCIAVFPAFVLSMLVLAHLLGGDGSTHPGVGHQSQSRSTPQAVLPVKGLLPPYSNQYMSWIATQSKPESQAGDALLHVAASSQSLWDPTSLRDSAHKKLVNVIGRNRFCYPPEQRSIKAVGRHVNFLLDGDGSDTDEGSILTANPLTGRELLDVSPPTPITFADMILGRKPKNTLSSQDSSCDSENAGSDETGMGECKAPEPLKPPSLFEFISFLTSHNFMTPTIVFPIVDTLGFLCSIWWTYWFSVKGCVCWIRLRVSRLS